MTSIGAGYDTSTLQFSPDGRVFQVEYAQKAVEKSGTVLGLRGKDGIVFAVEKPIPTKLYEFGANNRIFTVDRHVGLAVAGVYADATQIVEIARSEASCYRSNFGVMMPLKYLKNQVAAYMHAYTLSSSFRPFGCSIMMGSYEHDGPELYCLDPSGTSFGYFGCALGKVSQSVKTEIEKLVLKEMTVKQLVKEAARIIYITHDEGKDKHFALELSWIGDITNRKHKIVPRKIFTEAEDLAKKAVEQNDSDEESI